MLFVYPSLRERLTRPAWSHTLARFGAATQLFAYSPAMAS